MTGPPEWEALSSTAALEQLFFLPALAGESSWWVVGLPEKPEESVLVSTAMAADLIRSHLRDCLAAAGWQVQLTQRGGHARWRLADVLAATEGGGDRLEVDYPNGEDELAVLCASVLAVSTRC